MANPQAGALAWGSSRKGEAETGKKLKPGDLMSRVGQFWRRNKIRVLCVYGEEHPKMNVETKDRLHEFRADLETRLARY